MVNITLTAVMIVHHYKYLQTSRLVFHVSEGKAALFQPAGWQCAATSGGRLTVLHSVRLVAGHFLWALVKMTFDTLVYPDADDS